ncbi:MAG: hypothetical protein WA783_13045, partial [Phormidesmis sp.]
QQTLESARDALMSAQKVMADVDEITGDPAVREQIRNLINGLGSLVSSTQSLEQHSEVASALRPLALPLGSAAEASTTPEKGERSSNSQLENYLNRHTGAGIQTVGQTDGQRPVLVFDGERYILRSPEQIASGSSKASVNVPTRLLEENLLSDVELSIED